MENGRIHVWIKGLVQGVGFRFFAERHAERLGLTGFVRNLPDGQVEVVAEGKKADLEAFLDLLRKGPPGAIVRDVEVQWEAWTGAYRDFQIRY